MTRKSKRELERTVADLEVNSDSPPLTWIDFMKLADGGVTPSDYGLTEEEVDREWEKLLEEMYRCQGGG